MTWKYYNEAQPQSPFCVPVLVAYISDHPHCMLVKSLPGFILCTDCSSEKQPGPGKCLLNGHDALPISMIKWGSKKLLVVKHLLWGHVLLSLLSRTSVGQLEESVSDSWLSKAPSGRWRWWVANHWQICEREWPRRCGSGARNPRTWKSSSIILIFFSQTSELYSNCKSTASVGRLLWDPSNRCPGNGRIWPVAIKRTVETQPSSLGIWIIGFRQIWDWWYICQRWKWPWLATKKFRQPRSPAKFKNCKYKDNFKPETNSSISPNTTQSLILHITLERKTHSMSIPYPVTRTILIHSRGQKQGICLQDQKKQAQLRRKHYRCTVERTKNTTSFEPFCTTKHYIQMGSSRCL